MNTVESIIKEELGKAIINLAVRDIKSWARKELNVLRQQTTYPVILSTDGKKIIIGNYTIEIVNDNCNTVIYDSHKIHTFYSKKAALLYCLHEKLGQLNKSLEILSIDKKVSQVYYDLAFYSAKLINKTSKLDTFKKQLYYSRYFEAKIKYQNYKRELEKTIANAKYIKIWDKIL